VVAVFGNELRRCREWINDSALGAAGIVVMEAVLAVGASVAVLGARAASVVVCLFRSVDATAALGGTVAGATCHVAYIILLISKLLHRSHFNFSQAHCWMIFHNLRHRSIWNNFRHKRISSLKQTGNGTGLIILKTPARSTGDTSLAELWAKVFRVIWVIAPVAFPVAKLGVELVVVVVDAAGVCAGV
jgi:hypothetical protein